MAQLSCRIYERESFIFSNLLLAETDESIYALQLLATGLTVLRMGYNLWQGDPVMIDPNEVRHQKLMEFLDAFAKHLDTRFERMEKLMADNHEEIKQILSLSRAELVLVADEIMTEIQQSTKFISNKIDQDRFEKHTVRILDISNELDEKLHLKHKGIKNAPNPQQRAHQILDFINLSISHKANHSPNKGLFFVRGNSGFEDEAHAIISIESAALKPDAYSGLIASRFNSSNIPPSLLLFNQLAGHYLKFKQRHDVLLQTDAALYKKAQKIEKKINTQAKALNDFFNDFAKNIQLTRSQQDKLFGQVKAPIHDSSRLKEDINLQICKSSMSNKAFESGAFIEQCIGEKRYVLATALCGTKIKQTYSPAHQYKISPPWYTSFWDGLSQVFSDSFTSREYRDRDKNFEVDPNPDNHLSIKPVLTQNIPTEPNNNGNKDEHTHDGYKTMRVYSDGYTVYDLGIKKMAKYIQEYAFNNMNLNQLIKAYALALPYDLNIRIGLSDDFELDAEIYWRPWNHWAHIHYDDISNLYYPIDFNRDNLGHHQKFASRVCDYPILSLDITTNNYIHRKWERKRITQKCPFKPLEIKNKGLISIDDIKQLSAAHHLPKVTSVHSNVCELVKDYLAWLSFKLHHSKRSGSSLLVTAFTNNKTSLIPAINNQMIPLTFPSQLIESLEHKIQKEKGKIQASGVGFLMPFYKFNFNEKRRRYELSIDYYFIDKQPQTERKLFCSFQIATFDQTTVNSFSKPAVEENQKNLPNLNEFLLQAMYGNFHQLQMPGEQTKFIGQGRFIVPADMPFPGLFEFYRNNPELMLHFDFKKYSNAMSQSLFALKDNDLNKHQKLQGVASYQSLPVYSANYTQIWQKVRAAIKTFEKVFEQLNENYARLWAYCCLHSSIDNQSLEALIANELGIIPPVRFNSIWELMAYDDPIKKLTPKRSERFIAMLTRTPSPYKQAFDVTVHDLGIELTKPKTVVDNQPRPQEQSSCRKSTSQSSQSASSSFFKPISASVLYSQINAEFESSFKSYTEKLRAVEGDDIQWGTHLELQAIADLWSSNIAVYEKGSPTPTLIKTASGESSATLEIFFDEEKRHYLLFLGKENNTYKISNGWAAGHCLFDACLRARKYVQSNKANVPGRESIEDIKALRNQVADKIVASSLMQEFLRKQFHGIIFSSSLQLSSALETCSNNQLKSVAIQLRAKLQQLSDSQQSMLESLVTGLVSNYEKRVFMAEKQRSDIQEERLGGRNFQTPYI